MPELEKLLFSSVVPWKTTIIGDTNNKNDTAMLKIYKQAIKREI